MEGRWADRYEYLYGVSFEGAYESRVFPVANADLAAALQIAHE